MDQLLKPSQRGDNQELKAAKPRSRGRGLWWLVLVLFLGLGFAWWRGFAPERQPQNARREPPPTLVVPATAAKGEIDVTLDALGTVSSLSTVTIRTQISGQLVSIRFKEGDEVKAGDLLAEIDSRPYQAALDQAKGALVRDQALLKGAEVDLARYQGLAAQNAVAHQTLDTQVALVAQYRGTVEADKAAVQAATVNLQFCRILAPSDGRVGLREVDQGNYVTPGDVNGIVVITQIRPISVLFTLPEDNLQAVAARQRAGAELPVTALDRASVKTVAEGKLLTFDSQIDPTTGTIKLRALFPNENGALFPNQFVNIRLLLDRHQNVVIVPTSAIQRGSPGTFAYLISDAGTVSVCKVTLGVAQGERVEIVDGLAAGDRVVVDGADRLRDGARVAVRADNRPAAPAGAPRANTERTPPTAPR
jgi:membrane fusion protein, multidrug efflux system